MASTRIKKALNHNTGGTIYLVQEWASGEWETYAEETSQVEASKTLRILAKVNREMRREYLTQKV